MFAYTNYIDVSLKLTNGATNSSQCRSDISLVPRPYQSQRR